MDNNWPKPLHGESRAADRASPTREDWGRSVRSLRMTSALKAQSSATAEFFLAQIARGAAANQPLAGFSRRDQKKELTLIKDCKILF